MFRIRITTIVFFVLGLFFVCSGLAVADDDIVCTISISVLAEPNTFAFEVDCSPAEAGYREFKFGDGVQFEVFLDEDGDSVEFSHSYPYTEGEVTEYEGRLLFEGKEFLFNVPIDDRPVLDVGEVIFRDWSGEFNPTWDWPFELRRTGVYTIGINTTCNGLAENHFRQYLWGGIEGPTESVFGNSVQWEFLKSPLVTSTLLLTDSVGNTVWSMEVFAPDCQIPAPEIFVQDGSIQAGDLISMTVRSQGEGSLLISTDQLIPEFPEECQPLGRNIPVKSLSCEPGERTVGVRVGQNASSVYLFARRWFKPVSVESSSEITLTVTPSYDCELGYEKGSEYNHAIFQIACEPDPMDWMTLDFGNEVQTDVVVSGTVEVETWYTQVDEPTAYTVTLALEGTTVATRSIIITPTGIGTGPVIPPLDFKEVYLPLVAQITVFVPKSAEVPYCHEYIANVATKGTICYIGPHTPGGLETSSDVYATDGDRFRQHDFRPGGGVFPVGTYIYGPFGMSFSEPNPR